MPTSWWISLALVTASAVAVVCIAVWLERRSAQRAEERQRSHRVQLARELRRIDHQLRWCPAGANAQRTELVRQRAQLTEELIEMLEGGE